MAKTPKIAGAPEFGKYIAPEESLGQRLAGGGEAPTQCRLIRHASSSRAASRRLCQ